MAAGASKRPAKRVAKRSSESKLPPVPSDREVLDAIDYYHAMDEASRKAHEDLMAARIRVVEVLKARGITNFHL